MKPFGFLAGVASAQAHIAGHVGDVRHVGEYDGSQFIHYRVQGKASLVAVGLFMTAHAYDVIVNINNSYIIWSYSPLDSRIVIQRLAAVPANIDHTVGVADVDGDSDVVPRTSTTKQIRFRLFDGITRGLNDVIRDGGGEVDGPGDDVARRAHADHQARDRDVHSASGRSPVRHGWPTCQFRV